MTALSADCHYGDHHWNGSSACECGARLRCVCGCFVREDNIEAHLAACPSLEPEVAAVVPDAPTKEPT